MMVRLAPGFALAALLISSAPVRAERVTVRDANGNTIGYEDHDSGGRVTVMDGNGNPTGYRRRDTGGRETTTDVNGNTVGSRSGDSNGNARGSRTR